MKLAPPWWARDDVGWCLQEDSYTFSFYLSASPALGSISFLSL